jgi:alpha-amylase
MVATCNEFGVDVIADAVINHMTTGVYNYPEAGYTQENFHYYSTENNCTKDISNWGDITESTNCMLGGLPDLATEQPYVRGKIADYLNSLLAAGVKGFRIDAARHIPIADLLAIKSQLTNQDVFIINEVAGSPPEPSAFAEVGATFSFDWSSMLKDSFTGFNGAYDLDIPNSQYRGMGDPLKTVTMVQNHDTERSGASVSYASGKGFLMASIYTLSEPFGMPMLYSGFAFNDFGDAPRVTAAGYDTCNSGSGPKSSYTALAMVCTSRWTAIKGMVRWHKYMDGKVKGKMWSNDYAYGYARGTNGYVLFNTKSGTAKFSNLKTGLAAGHYCDVVSGGANPVKVVKGKKACVGTTITVKKGGYLAATLPSMTALAIATYAKY